MADVKEFWPLAVAISALIPLFGIGLLAMCIRNCFNQVRKSNKKILTRIDMEAGGGINTPTQKTQTGQDPSLTKVVTLEEEFPPDSGFATGSFADPQAIKRKEESLPLLKPDNETPLTVEVYQNQSKGEDLQTISLLPVEGKAIEVDSHQRYPYVKDDHAFGDSNDRSLSIEKPNITNELREHLNPEIMNGNDSFDENTGRNDDDFEAQSRRNTGQSDGKLQSESSQETLTTNTPAMHLEDVTITHWAGSRGSVNLPVERPSVWRSLTESDGEESDTGKPVKEDKHETDDEDMRGRSARRQERSDTGESLDSLELSLTGAVGGLDLDSVTVDQQREECVSSKSMDVKDIFVPGKRRRSCTPDMEDPMAQFQNVPYQAQAQLKFPSEIHRGAVEKEPGLFLHFELTTPVDEEDKFVQMLYAESKKKKLQSFYKEFVKSLGTNIPDCIHSLVRSEQSSCIYINIDKDSVSQTWEFLERQCPRYANRKLLRLVEQTERPNFLTGGNIEGGMRAYAIPPAQYNLQRILTERGYFEAIKDKLPVATLGCVVQRVVTTPESPVEYFGVTVMHLLKREPSRGKVYVDTILAFPSENGHPELVHLGSEGHGILGYEHIDHSDKLIDILLIPIREEVVRDPRFVKYLRVKEVDDTGQVHTRDLNVTRFQGSEEDLPGRMVQKDGAISGVTRGETKCLDMTLIQGCRACAGVFVVACRRPNVRPMALEGDSGAVVRSHDADCSETQQCLAYGLVHKIMPDLKMEDECFYNLVICVSMKYCLIAMEKMLDLKLQFCQPPLSEDMQRRGRMQDIPETPKSGALDIQREL